MFILLRVGGFILKNFKAINLVGIIIAIIFFLGIASIYITKGKYPQVEGEFYITDSKGTHEKYEKLTDYKFLNMKKGDWIQVEFKNTVYDGFRKTFWIENQFFYSEVFVNDELIYCNSDSPENAIYNQRLDSFTVNTKKNDNIDKSVDVDIKIKLTSTQRESLYSFPNIYVLNNTRGHVLYFQQNIVRLGGATVLFFVGFVLFLFEILRGENELEHMKILYIAAAFILCSIWLVAQTQIGSIFISNNKRLFIVKYLAIMLLNVVFVLYIRENQNLENRTKKYLKYLSISGIGFIVLALVLQLFDIFYMNQSFKIMLILGVIGMMGLIYLYIKIEKIKFLGENHIYNMSLILCGIYIFVAVIKQNFFNNGNLLDESTVSFGVLALIVIVLVKYINGVITKFMDKTQILSLEKLAYIDSLTGIANRNMCEKKMDEIDNISVGTFGMITFDLKGLKYVNDNFGHHSGDEMIAVFAKAISTVFDENNSFVGRMGGDEFIVIVNEEKIEDIPNMIDNLNKYLRHINDSNKYKFTMAYHHGVSLCNRTRNQKAWKSYSAADSNMYENEKYEK